MARRPWTWTEKKVDKLNKVTAVLEEFERYKPLTLRQIYYQLVGKGYIENTVSQYTMLSGLIKWARIEGYIPWEDIEDRVRAYHKLTGWMNQHHFIREELDYFLTGYQRNLMQTQDTYMEIWIEKDALSSIFTRVSAPYTVPVVVCRGFTSVSFLHDFKERLSYQQDKYPLMLYFGDFDPSGVAMLTAMEETLTYELDLPAIRYKRVALLKEDIATHHLPHNPNALKKTDSRAKRHVMEYGEIAVELDALRPDILEEKITESIEGELDGAAFQAEVARHHHERAVLSNLREETQEFLSERGKE